MGKSPYNSSSETDTDTDLDSIDESDFEEYALPKEAVIIFMDVDSFEVQVRGKNQGISPELLKTQPFVVVNEHDVITAVNYPAKEFGIRRSKECTLNVTKQRCSMLRILRIPNHFGKPDALGLRRASDDIYESLEKSIRSRCKFSHPKIERASKDEFYIDVTDEVFYRVHQLGHPVPLATQVAKIKKTKCILEAPSYSATGEKLSYRTLQVLTNKSIIQDRHITEALLMHGAVIAHETLIDIRNETGFILSCGVSSNKLLAKLGGGQNKPEAITVLPQSSLGRVSKKIKLEDIPGLGGAYGTRLQQKGIKTMSQLAHFDRVKLMKIMGNEDALKFHQMAIGYDASKVVAKKSCNSLTCGITFSYKTRMMRTPDHFYAQLKNRFLEMRDSLIYECNRHGLQRIPRSFTLEIRTRKKSLKTPFKECIQIIETDNLEECIALEVEKYQDGQDIGRFHLPPEWTTLYEDFIDRMMAECQLSIFDQFDYNAACAAVRKISEINLKAKYNKMSGDED